MGNYYDNTEGVKNLEEIAVRGKEINIGFTYVFYKQLDQYDPNAPYPGRKFTERERKAIEEVEKEYEEIHKRHRP